MADSGSAQAHAEELLATARSETSELMAERSSAVSARRRRGTIVG
jgi:hypothetical protein